ncbi:MAG TPA: hypothetical protein VKM94_14735 [Blastocatellia bacterium]|nr:hypothetical protein [Blastocatellia bacterium]
MRSIRPSLLIAPAKQPGEENVLFNGTTVLVNDRDKRSVDGFAID